MLAPIFGLPRPEQNVLSEGYIYQPERALYGVLPSDLRESGSAGTPRAAATTSYKGELGSRRRHSAVPLKDGPAPSFLFLPGHMVRPSSRPPRCGAGWHPGAPGAAPERMKERLAEAEDTASKEATAKESAGKGPLPTDEGAPKSKRSPPEPKAKRRSGFTPAALSMRGARSQPDAGQEERDRPGEEEGV